MKIKGVSARCGVNAETVRQWAEKGWLEPSHVTVEGTWLYYSEDVEDFARRRRDCSEAIPKLKAAYLERPVQNVLVIPSGFDAPPEGFVE